MWNRVVVTACLNAAKRAPLVGLNVIALIRVDARTVIHRSPILISIAALAVTTIRLAAVAISSVGLIAVIMAILGIHLAIGDQ
jgi:hypothetical protein